MKNFFEFFSKPGLFTLTLYEALSAIEGDYGGISVLAFIFILALLMWPTLRRAKEAADASEKKLKETIRNMSHEDLDTFRRNI